MPNKAERVDALHLVRPDEIDVLFGTASPNPERIGCPSQRALSALARRERDLDDPGYEHLTHCSDCYNEFRALQRPSHVHPAVGTFVRRRWFAGAAAGLILSAAGGWIYSRATGTVTAPIQRPAIVDIRIQLDLRPYAVGRSAQGRGSPPPLTLSADRLHATILLPGGSEPGAYDVRVFDASSRSWASASVRAEIRDFVTTIEAVLDLRTAPPGEYRLALRRDGEAWASYPARLR